MKHGQALGGWRRAHMTKSQDKPIGAGVFAALLTPRRPNTTEVDGAALLEYIDRVTAGGVDGLVLFGSTGEFVHFDLDERMRALVLAVRRSRVPVFVNVSHSTLAGAMMLAEDAQEAGAKGVLLMPPHFYRYTPEQVLEFYHQFSRGIQDRIPVYLYNLPSFTNAISIETANGLLTSGAFAGIKDSSCDPKLLDALIELHNRHQFRLFVGSEWLFPEGRRRGADGIVSGVAAAVPELVVAADAAIRACDTEAIERLGRRLGEFMEHVDRFPATLAIKQAAVSRGWIPNALAVPLDENTASDLIGFHNWFRSWLPDVLAECAQTAGMRS